MKLTLPWINLWVAVIFCGSSDGRADESHKLPDSAKAVTEASPQEGMKLSEKAILALDLQFQIVDPTRAPRHIIPISALVFHQAQVGVYRVRRGWFKLIDVDVIGKSAQNATIKSPELRSGDQIVSKNVSLLRITELDITSGGGGHD